MKPFTSKNILSACLIMAAAFTFSSCEDSVLRGRGDDVTRTRQVGKFDAIEMGGEFEVYLSQGVAEDIILEGPENVLADVRTTTNNHKLKIDFRSNRVRIAKPVRVYITTPHLTKLCMSGNNEVRGVTPWKVNDLELKVSGRGSIDLTITSADEIESSISGSGQIVLGGEARKHKLDISGSGKLKAFDLYTKTTNVHISGSGQGDVRASENLEASISGSGDVRYKGNPTVKASVSGSGRVRKWD